MLFTAFAALAVLNAFAWWGAPTAWTVFAVLETVVCSAVVVYGCITARRARGLGRVWRLIIVVAMAGFLFGEIMWWIGPDSAQPAMATSYFAATVVALVALMVIVRDAGPIAHPPGESRRHLVATSVIDGAIATAAFGVVVALGNWGATTATLPRSGNEVVEWAYSMVVCIAVVYAAVFAMVYGADKPHRFNFMFLAGGLVTTTASDRLVGYFDAVGSETGMLWGQIGFVLGPLLIAISLGNPQKEREQAHRSPGAHTRRVLLPYIGYFAAQTLLAFHVLSGRPLGLLPVTVAMVMITLVVVRQIVAIDAERKLTARLYDAQRRLTHQVYHDALTGLPNRLLFAKRLEEAMRDGPFVLIFIDLDDFKEVNDRFGHAGGDDLLRAVGERLSRNVGDRDTLARIGGDEYAMLISEESEDPEVVADRLRVALREPFAVHGTSVRVRASMGLVHSTTGGPSQTSDDLLRQADISMYAGKRLGKDSAVVYQPASRVQSDFPTALREAAGGPPEGFRLVYQPVVSLTSGAIVAVEALARWTAPNGMEIPPETFVSVAESAGLGARLDELVLDLACREVMSSGLEVDVHVNVGAARLGNPGFEHQVRRACERHALPARRLVLEITETLPIIDLAHAAAQIERFRAVGVKAALDDFGAGYNSLTYLHALPVHIVKLDRSLAVGAEPERDLTLYRSVIGLCTALDLEVIAEGIETTVQAGTILAAGCRLAQGHLFGRPSPLADIRREWHDVVTDDQGEHQLDPGSYVNGS
ncbi:putative bifunctional diguanylate cyclase/phosphodiesterase [Mycobacterium sp. pV006]|uniref:putative bifunctional diguanylate cyclase/phosphodiesterase n=1 Tax=Mycobacterium sp. pV006 TaxID=3238983 RepID=UPI00351B99E8